MSIHIDYFANMSINIESNFHSHKKGNLVMKIEYEVLASLISKKMENCPNLCEF
jgi:hypothetical protein